MLIVDRDEPDADLIALARAAETRVVNVPLDWLAGDVVTRLHAAGLLVAAGTVDDEAGVVACLELGIDFVDTNRPSVTVVARDRHRDAITDRLRR
jgi:glycerophosphoryl diester phosphodiesterase